MRKKATILIILAHIFLNSCAHSKDFVLYKKGEVEPIIYFQGASKSAADDFALLFKKLGANSTISNQAPKGDKPFIQLEVNTKLSGFSLLQIKNQLQISAQTEKDLKKAIRYFFSTYSNLNQFTFNANIVAQETISVPLGLSYNSDAIIAYKEPYFAENFNENFRLWNNTNTLEETWGLWGHNIGRLIKVTPQMTALINGELNEEQLNFSSPALYKALETAIGEKLADYPEANKFMIMPYDNEMVCECKQCLSAGNTKTNASPAVFALIDKLANKFPNASFYSTAYVSTETPPTKPTKANVGVMISTMSFPKGIVLETSNKAQAVKQKFTDWKKITKNIYLWDYAINFDNYFDSYPTVSIMQKNLQFYIKNGVTGIFMHGSDEGSFAAFGNLKCYLYAQLFNNPQVDLKKHINLFLENKYPTLGKQLADYYIQIEDIALNSNRTIDIYGGIKNSVNKYLKQEELEKYLNLILTSRDQLASKDKKVSDALLMSFIFQELELSRTNGLGKFGYATYENGQRTIKPEIEKYLVLLKELSASTGIGKYNEIGFTLSDYLASWNARIIGSPYQNLFYQKSFKVTSLLDEEHADSKILNDGALGFQDYYNNWLINSAPKLSLETATAGLQKATLLQMDFLYDKKHKIYPPEKVTVYIGSRKFETVLGEKEENGTNRKIIRATIPIKINANDSLLKIEITKQSQKQKRSMACDEIILK